MKAAMNPHYASATRTMIPAAPARGTGLRSVLTLMLLLCLAMPAAAADMVSNGGFDGFTGWSFGGTGASYSTLQNHGTLTGAGSLLQNATGRNTATTGTTTQAASVAVNSVIQSAADVSLWAMEQFIGAASVGTTVTVALRYQDATSVEIFTGTVAANSPWTNILNTTTTIFPLTLTQNVNQITVTTYTKNGNNAAATSDLFVDDIVITYTAASADSLTVTGNTAVATTANPGDSDIQMNFLQLNSDSAGNGSVVITSATVFDTNITTTGTISNLRVHIDNDTNYVNGVLGTATVANWNGQSTVVDLTAIAEAARTIIAGTPKFLWVTYDIDPAAVDQTTVRAEVTAIGVLAPDTAPLGGPWESNFVLITTGLGCGGCHPNPMVDGANRDVFTGGVVGSHTKHAATYNYDCTLCHLAVPDTPRHRDTFIAMTDPIDGVASARYTTAGKTGVESGAGFVRFPQTTTPVVGSCQNTACHGGINTAGNFGGPTGAGPQWGHNSADTCTFCHNSNKTNAGGTANAYPSAASPFRSANAAGAHTLHLTGTNSLMSGGVACADCHTLYATIAEAGHVDTNVIAPADVPFPAGSDARLGGVTPTYTAGTLTCSVYCHGVNQTGGSNPTPAWTANWTNYPTGCSNSCHGLPPANATHTGQAWPTSCISCHPDTVTSTTNPPTINTAFHINGAVDAAGGCSGCHGGDNASWSNTNFWPSAGGAYPRRGGEHEIHITRLMTKLGYSIATITDQQQKTMCGYCHTYATEPGEGGHNDAAPADVGSFNPLWSALIANYPSTADDGTYAAASQSCSNIDCHNNKATNDTASNWLSGAASSCAMCHTVGGTGANPTSGLHNMTAAGVQKHDSTLTGGCGACHVMPTYTAGSTHMNGTWVADSGTNNDRGISRTNMTFTQIAPSGGNSGTCMGTGLTGCHSDGGVWARQWSTAANSTASTVGGANCNVCHGQWDSWAAGTTHYKAGGSDSATNSRGAVHKNDPEDCNNCHAYTSVTGRHKNGFVTMNSTGTTYARSGATAGCSACHGGATEAGYNYPISVFDQQTVAGPTIEAGGCISCHGTNATTSVGAITSASAGSFGMTKKHVSGVMTDDQCKVCHNDATQPMNTGSANRDKIQLRDPDSGAVIVIDQALATTNATRNLNTVTFCTKCHDANGATFTKFGATATQPFGNGVTVKDVASMYNSAVTGKTHNYTYNVTPQLVKARSPHGKPGTNTMKNETARTTHYTTDAAPVGCQSCHPSHGGAATNPVPVISGGSEINSTTVNASMMLTGYSEPGVCWTCHNLAGVKDYFGDNTGGNASNSNWTGIQNSSFDYKKRNYWSRHQVQTTAFAPTRANARANADTTAGIACSVCHNPHGATTWVATSGTVAYQSFSLRGSWMTSPYLEDRAPSATGPTSANWAGKGPLGPRTDVTQAYNRPATLGMGYSAAGGTGWEGYYLDENTFGPPAKGYPTALPPTMTETATQFGGLCANCHATTVGASSGGTVANMQGYLNAAGSTGVADWSTTAKIHNTVKGWYVAGNSVDIVNFTNNPKMRLLYSTYTSAVRVIQVTASYSPRTEFAWGVNLTNGTKQAYHRFSCSKCHTPHASSLPRLMVSNCLDVGTGTTARAAKAPATNNSGATQRPAYTYPTYGTGAWSGVATGVEVAQQCHNAKKTNTAGGGGWNQLTGW